MVWFSSDRVRVRKGQKNDRKACLLTLLRAASGTTLPKIVNKPVLGGLAIYNQTARRYESITGERVEGVSHQDLVAHNDMMSLFRYEDFTKSKNYVKLLQEEFGLGDAFEPITRLEKNKEVVNGIKITDWRLKEFLEFCESTLTDVYLRIIETLKIRIMDVLYKDGSLVELSDIPLDSFTKFEQEAYRWFLDMEGRKDFNSLYNDCRRLLTEKMSEFDMESNNKGTKYRNKWKHKDKDKEIRKFILEYHKERESWIKQWDKGIIAHYHRYYKCDKDRILPNPPGELGVEFYKRKYSNYRHYVRNVMPKEYHYLMDCLSKMVYPEFLLNHYEKDSKLKKFVESLPNSPEIN